MTRRWASSKRPSGALRTAVLACLALAAAGTLSTAIARTDRGPASKRPDAIPAGRNAKPAAPAGPLLTIVTLSRQRIAVYGRDGVVAHSAISSGARGHATPTGMFTILQKRRYHESNIYSGAPMPFMQRITWSGIALHAGVLPGYPASHGCIRLSYPFATQLWGMTRMNQRVVVAREEVRPVDIRHDRLPKPLMTPGPDSLGGPRAGEPRTELAALETAAKADTADTPSPKLLNPEQRAQAKKIQVTAEAAAAAKAVRAAVQDSAQKAKEANRAIAALRDAERDAIRAHERLQAALAGVEAATTEDAADRARAAMLIAQSRLDEASDAVRSATAAERRATPEALAAARTAWEAEAANRTAAEALKAAEKITDPLSIFVSRKTGRVYIRQGWQPVHEAAASFKDPEAPLGTHLYLAMGTDDDGAELQWLTVSMGQPETSSHERSLRAAAADALERVELTEETRAFIADRVWVGASLIISEQGLGTETGTYTDFIVQER